MKKNTTKILVAALALFMAIGIATGSTFAWFALNTEVSATGMQVVAKSDNTFLLIGTDNTADAIQTANTKTVALTVDAADSDLYPCTPATETTAALLNTTNGKKVGGDAITVAGVKVDSAATAAAETNWYTANAATVANKTMIDGGARQLTTFTDYVIVKTLYLTVADGSNNANNLSVTATITAQNTGNVDAVRVMVVTDDGGFAILKTGNLSANLYDGEHNTAITDTTVRTVTVYIYVDGEDSTVYTNNKANLDAATIGLTFDVDPVPAP